eukprot:Opistho-2@5918
MDEPSVLDDETQNDLELSFKKKEPMRGRRAQLGNFTRQESDDVLRDSAPSAMAPSARQEGVGASPEPARAVRKGGWGNESVSESKSNLAPSSSGGKREALQSFSFSDSIDDSRRSDDKRDSDDEMPVIPDLEQVQEEDLSTQIAAPPSVKMSRMATIRELDSDLSQQFGFLASASQDGVDLKLLTRVLASQAQIAEPDQPWDWDKTFTEISSELQAEQESAKAPDANDEDAKAIKDTKGLE